ncbi:hypothetical protein T492DRAFT_834104 [Pavlovales sp. CCMP2436]|nr:hypothetical protein T492DRAFT_834104 [Pavlovales sp. CCMP2436]
MVEETREANTQTCRTSTRKLEVLSTSKLAHLAARFLPRGMTDATGAARDQVVRVGFVPHQQTTAEHALLANAAANSGFIRTDELRAGTRTLPLVLRPLPVTVVEPASSHRPATRWHVEISANGNGSIMLNLFKH